jgi:8-oxo-dGTP pyrophosphatase MutT (NUDIX family)
MDTNRVAKIFIMRGDSMLLLFSKHLNKWHLPGGHVHDDESYEDGLKREVEEETGCKLKFYHKIRPLRSNVCLYIGNLYHGPIKISDEHSKYIWVPIDEALNLHVCKFTFKDIRYLQTLMNAVKSSMRVDNNQQQDNYAA